MVPKAVAHLVLLAALEMMPVMGRTEGVMAVGHPNTTAVAEKTGKELSLVLTSEGHHPPVRDEPLLWWVNPWDLSSKLFTLDDATEGMEWESLNEGITAMLEALNQARGALRDIIVPTSWVFT